MVFDIQNICFLTFIHIKLIDQSEVVFKKNYHKVKVIGQIFPAFGQLKVCATSQNGQICKKKLMTSLDCLFC